jgi:hypothetical protein
MFYSRMYFYNIIIQRLPKNVLCKICVFVNMGRMDQFRNDVALWVNKLRGRYDAIFIEPENVNKIS